MLTEHINHITLAIRSIERGDKESAALLIQRVKTNTRNRRMKNLAYALIDLHKLQPYIRQAIKEQKEWQEHLAAQTQTQQESQS